jgi:hypothetical protein
MKYIKTYEEVYSFTYDIDTDPPKIGDYVIMRSTANNNELKQFIENSVGQIIEEDGDEITIDFSDIPEKLKQYFILSTRPYHYKLLQYWSDNKEELEEILAQKKYNL